MAKQINFFRSVLGIALVTVLILLVPLIAMQFTNEVNWSLVDFIVAGTLMFSIGLFYVVIIRYKENIAYRAAIGFALGTTLLLIWGNLAVGLIGAGPNPGNLMYLGVIAIEIVGIFLSRFKPEGLERTMFATALSLVLLASIALLMGMHNYPESSVTEIIGVNGFFAILFTISGLLFRHCRTATIS